MGIEIFLTKSAPGLLLILILADVLSGLLKSARTKRWASDISYSGMTRKMGMLLSVGVCYFIENFSGLPLIAAASLLYCMTEGMSLIENLHALGVPIPRALGQYFKKLADPAALTSLDEVAAALQRRDDQ